MLGLRTLGASSENCLVRCWLAYAPGPNTRGTVVLSSGLAEAMGSYSSPEPPVAATMVAKGNLMKNHRLFALVSAALLAAGVVATSGAPAWAATSGGTTASFTLTGGTLSITVPTGTVSFGSAPEAVAGQVVTGSLGQVQVNDARDAAAGSGWVATVISAAFTPTAGPAIAASAVSYNAGAITKVGTATYTANNPSDLTGVVAVVTATGITGDNSATWNPTISIAVPGGTAAGTYGALITHSVS